MWSFGLSSFDLCCLYLKIQLEPKDFLACFALYKTKVLSVYNKTREHLCSAICENYSLRGNWVAEYKTNFNQQAFLSLVWGCKLWNTVIYLWISCWVSSHVWDVMVRSFALPAAYTFLMHGFRAQHGWGRALNRDDGINNCSDLLLSISHLCCPTCSQVVRRECGVLYFS